MSGCTSFFQTDLGFRNEALAFMPNEFRDRVIIDFRCIDCISYRKIDQFREWMSLRWHEIPADGREAFLNRFVLFIKNQKVAIGESSPTISFKVNIFILIFTLYFLYLHTFICFSKTSIL